MKKILKYKLDKNFVNNNELIKKYLIYLYYTFFNISNNLITNNYLLSLKCFHPLPTKFNINNNSVDKITRIDNILQFEGKENCNRIVTTDKILPFHMNNPIPFSFPIYRNSEIKLVNSNIYYYEIEILESTRESWPNQTIVIGYGTIKCKIHTNPGWNNNTF